jgi:hypothetical protein
MALARPHLVSIQASLLSQTARIASLERKTAGDRSVACGIERY